MSLYAVHMGYGLFVVRAKNENHARRVAHEGPVLNDDTTASEYGVEFEDDAIVLVLEPEGAAGLLDSYYG